MQHKIQLFYSSVHYKNTKNIVERLSNQYRLPNHLTSDDVLQEVLLKIHNNLHLLENILVFEGWVYTITKNYLNTLYVRYKKDRELCLSNVDESIINNVTGWYCEFTGYDHLVLKDLHKAINKLPQGMKNIAIKYYIECIPMKDIAKELGVTISTVKTQLWKGRNHLKKLICCD